MSQIQSIKSFIESNNASHTHKFSVITLYISEETQLSDNALDVLELKFKTKVYKTFEEKAKTLFLNGGNILIKYHHSTEDEVQPLIKAIQASFVSHQSGVGYFHVLELSDNDVQTLLLDFFDK